MRAGFSFELMRTKRLAPCATQGPNWGQRFSVRDMEQASKQRARRALGTDNEPCFRDALPSAKCVGPCAQGHGGSGAVQLVNTPLIRSAGTEWYAFGPIFVRITTAERVFTPVEARPATVSVEPVIPLLKRAAL